ncbi:hypothetical protein QYE76_012985 [Lolium multiflorum]|uniref:DDE Tnp4 domain-containing protein n=1 Tax=Lolium multiflorum TaxID=4521 RepID=A0AAD8X452_LOLMU|nr:hypothetical protein QYE76_012985 [Lolium multiflorum]
MARRRRLRRWWSPALPRCSTMARTTTGCGAARRGAGWWRCGVPRPRVAGSGGGFGDFGKKSPQFGGAVWGGDLGKRTRGGSGRYLYRRPGVLLTARTPRWGRDCIGAIDGTHVTSRVPRSESLAYRGRKHYASQNMLGVVEFDMRFTYVLARWEGSAHDSTIPADSLERHDSLQVPEGTRRPRGRPASPASRSTGASTAGKAGLAGVPLDGGGELKEGRYRRHPARRGSQPHGRPVSSSSRSTGAATMRKTSSRLTRASTMRKAGLTGVLLGRGGDCGEDGILLGKGSDCEEDGILLDGDADRVEDKVVAGLGRGGNSGIET